jgi:hypothetical protein
MRNEQLLRPPFRLALLVGAFGLIASACSSSSSGGDCYDYTTFDGTAPAVHFQADVLPIFRQSCGLSSSCHGSENPPAAGQHYLGPSLSDPAPTAAQIKEILDGMNQKSADEPDMNVVTAGHPETSFLMYKLDGPNDPTSTDPSATIVDCVKLKCAASMTCLLPMPSGGPQLPAEERDTIRRWIAQGAKND